MAHLELTGELDYYNQHKAELLDQHKNKYIVIKGNEVLGAYGSEQEAYRAGVEKIGNKPFLIKLVTDIADSPTQAPNHWVGMHVA